MADLVPDLEKHGHPCEAGDVEFHEAKAFGAWREPHVHLIAEDWPAARKTRAGDHIDKYHTKEPT